MQTTFVTLSGAKQSSTLTAPVWGGLRDSKQVYELIAQVKAEPECADELLRALAEEIRQTQEVDADEVAYENFVFAPKYASPEALRVLRRQIRACLATEEKADRAGLIDLGQKNQLFILLAMLVGLRMVEEAGQFEAAFLRQMGSFFPDLFPEPKAYESSLYVECAKWRQSDGRIPRLGEWLSSDIKMSRSKKILFAKIGSNVCGILRQAINR